MKKIGITGSLASGKTTASKILSAKYGPLFSADDAVKKLYKKSFVKKVISKKFNIKNSSNLKMDENMLSAIITPDKDIIPGSNKYNPAYLVFNNYEIILSWNRSLRFALAVCTLKDKFKNEI